jgi:hypothetical protein
MNTQDSRDCLYEHSRRSRLPVGPLKTLETACMNTQDARDCLKEHPRRSRLPVWTLKTLETACRTTQDARDCLHEHSWRSRLPVGTLKTLGEAAADDVTVQSYGSARRTQLSRSLKRLHSHSLGQKERSAVTHVRASSSCNKLAVLFALARFTGDLQSSLPPLRQLGCKQPLRYSQSTLKVYDSCILGMSHDSTLTGSKCSSHILQYGPLNTSCVYAIVTALTYHGMTTYGGVAMWLFSAIHC